MLLYVILITPLAKKIEVHNFTKIILRSYSLPQFVGGGVMMVAAG